MTGRFADPLALYRSLRGGWSAETASGPFDRDNPAQNQCSVTALAVQHFFGGEIVKTPTAGGTHFYNRIGGVAWDLSIGQFREPIPFADLPSSTAEALADSSPDKLKRLLRAVEGRAD